jgi:hypothetical protein
VPNIFWAKPGDYRKATQRIYHAPDQASFTSCRWFLISRARLSSPREDPVTLGLSLLAGNALSLSRAIFHPLTIQTGAVESLSLVLIS